MKNTILIIFTVITFYSLRAQTVLYSDNFDSYTVGMPLVEQNSSNWTTWSHIHGGVQDPLISNANAASLPNSVYLTGGNNLLYEFEGQTSGEFDIDFDYFVPSFSNGAYFAFQHFLTPEAEYAYECYFSNDSSGYLVVAGNLYYFTYPINSWFHIKSSLNLNLNLVSFFVNDILISAWPFNFTTSGNDGTCQMGAANFLAASPLGSGTYYMDNFVFSEIVAANLPNIVLNIDSITNYSVNYLEGGDYTFNMKNSGEHALFFKIIPSYDIPNPDPTSTGETILSNCGGEYTSISSQYFLNVSIASSFPGDLLQNQIGRTINQIDLSIHNIMGVTSAKIKVYGLRTQLFPTPGPEIYEQSFIPVEGCNYISLTSPVVIDGSDIAIGAEFIIDPDFAGVGSIGCDSSSNSPYGDWYNTGEGWTRLSITNPDLSYNWCIEARVDGTPIEPWMHLNYSTGAINSHDSLNIITHFGADDIQLNDSKAGRINIFSNDPDTELIVINVQVNFTVSVNENNAIDIQLYPNPANEYVNVTSKNIIKVEIYNLLAQKIFEEKCNDSHITIPTNNFKAGTYIIKIFTEKGSASKKVIIQ